MQGHIEITRSSTQFGSMDESSAECSVRSHPVGYDAQKARCQRDLQEGGARAQAASARSIGIPSLRGT